MTANQTDPYPAPEYFNGTDPEILERLRWLADKRETYIRPGTQMEEHLRAEVSVVRHIADILEGINDGTGWLPSLFWDEWDKMMTGNDGLTAYERRRLAIRYGNQMGVPQPSHQQTPADLPTYLEQS